MSDEKKNRKDEQDSFWDISRLVPQKPRSSKTAPPSTKTTPVAVHLPQRGSTSGSREEQKLTSPKPTTAPQRPVSTAPAVFAEYSDFSSFIPQVKVLNWKSTYNYYETFCRQATVIHKKHGAECPEAAFSHYFSYVAQYSQLNRRQLEWYLWWRECVRNGKFLKVDVSYINLLIFEIINLGNTIDTAKSLDILISLWAHYKDEYPQLAGTLVDWICDYSLIYNLPIPFPDKRIDSDLFSHATLPEAFYNFDVTDTELFARFLLSSCNAYNYRKSKFYKGENKSIYDEHIPKAIRHLLEQIDVKEFLARQPRKKASRTSFTGALCSYKTKKQIEIEYVSLRDSHEVRNYISDVVKYAENKVRTYIGIRSKLTVRKIDERAVAAIDAYFARFVSSDGGIKPPEYEKLYDSVCGAFSMESAVEIERQSWEITEKLVDAFEENDADPPQEITAVPTTVPTEREDGSEQEQFMKQIARYSAFFACVLANNVGGQNEFVKKNKLLIEAVVDEINEKAVECFGDILIEEADSGYRIIEDYRHMFE